MTAIGDQIRAWRKEHGWSQSTVQRETGVSEATISNWETGRSTPSKRNLAKLEGYDFPITLDDLPAIRKARAKNGSHRKKESQVEDTPICGGGVVCQNPATTHIEVKLGHQTSRTKPTKIHLCEECAALEKHQEQETGACDPKPKSYRFYPR